MIAAFLLGSRASGPSAQSLFFPWLCEFAAKAGLTNVVYGSTARKVDLVSLPLATTTSDSLTNLSTIDTVVFGHAPAHYEVVQTGLSLIGFFDGTLPAHLLAELRALAITGTVTEMTPALAAPLVLSRLSQLSKPTEGNFTSRVASVLRDNLGAGSFASATLMLGSLPTSVFTSRNHQLHYYVVSHHRSFYLVVSTISLPSEIRCQDMQLYRWPLNPCERGTSTVTFNFTTLRNRWARWTNPQAEHGQARPEEADPMRYARALAFLNDWLLNHSN